MAPFRESDFGTWWFQPGGADLVMYPTQVGSMMGARLDTFPRSADRDYTESVRLLHSKGIDPLTRLGQNHFSGWFPNTGF